MSYLSENVQNLCLSSLSTVMSVLVDCVMWIFDNHVVCFYGPAVYGAGAIC